MQDSFRTDPVAVQFPDIEGQLADLWRGSQDDLGRHAPAARMAVLTLLALCRRPESADEASRAAAALAADHPARAIIVSAPGGQEQISATVSVSCRLLGHVERQLCSEQIRVDASGIDLERISSYVQPLALPDVPLVLWLADYEPRPDGAFDRLAQLCDRVVLDTRTTEDLPAALKWISGRMAPAQPGVVDLAWVALAPSRAAFADLFDPEEPRKRLAVVDEVTVRARSPQTGSRPGAEAALMAGWVASRLGLQGLSLVRDADHGLHFTARGGKRLCLMLDGVSALDGIALAAGANDRFEAAFDVSREEARLATTIGDLSTRFETRLAGRSADQILCGALEIARLDPVYAASVECAWAIASQAQPSERG